MLQTEPEVLKVKSPLWGPWATVGLGLAVLAGFLIAQVIVAVVILVAKIVANPSLDVMTLVSGLASNGLIIAVATIASGVVGIGLIILFIRIRKTSLSEYLGLRAVSGKTVLTVLAVTAVLILMTTATDYIPGSSHNANFMIDAYKTSGWPPLLWIGAVVFAPAFEETFFRGFLLSGLRQSRLGTGGAIAVTALGWAALHIQYDLWGMGTVMVLGVALGIMRVKTGSLWMTMLVHGLWNTVALVGTAMAVGMVR